MLDNIRALCAAHKVSLSELEKACGLGRNTVTRWNTNEPSVYKVKAVADFFGVTVDSLLDPSVKQTVSD